MGNLNCCFMIIAVKFFFSSQLPRGTVYVFVSLFRHNTTIHNKKYFECLENHCHFKASRKKELLHHVVQKHRSRTSNHEIRKLNFESRKKYFRCFVSPCKYQSEERVDVFRHVATCHPGTRVLSAGIKPKTTRTYWAQRVPNPKIPVRKCMRQKPIRKQLVIQERGFYPRVLNPKLKYWAQP